jgi:hypothetical protein
MRTTTRLVLSCLALLVALAAATASAAGPSASGERQFGAGATTGEALRLKPALRRALAANRVGAARRAATRQATLGGSFGLEPGEYPGFAYCGNDVVYAWPADAPSHDITLTRTHFVFSANGTFNDAVVEPGPYYVIQTGGDFYLYDIEFGEVVYGPTEYADAWVPYYLPENTDRVAFMHEILTADGGMFAPAQFTFVTAVGPTVVTPPFICQP